MDADFLIVGALAAQLVALGVLLWARWSTRRGGAQ